MSKYQTSVLALQLSGQDLKLQWIIRSEQPFAGSAKGLRDDPSTTYRPINGNRNLWMTKYAPYLVSTNRLSYDWNEVTQETMFCRAQYLDEGVRCGVSIVRRNWLLYTFADYQEGKWPNILTALREKAQKHLHLLGGLICQRIPRLFL